MLRKIIFPLFLGLAGCAILIWLALWQMDRLAWKQGILDGINARLAADPVPLRTDVTEAADEYTRVTLTGTPTGAELHVLVSGTAAGTGYRAIARFVLDDGQVILLDQGLLPLEAKDAPPLTTRMMVTGTLLWPDDETSSTPDPDLDRNIWFARNVDSMSAALDTLPVMVVATETAPADPRLTPLPVATADIPNNHFEYAVTWSLLAIVWAIMTLFLILRTLRTKDA
jgi:surfeit locus 1 family protein